jgi:hypothetical protein
MEPAPRSPRGAGFFSAKPTAIPLKINGKALKREISKPTFPGGEKKESRNGPGFSKRIWRNQ